MKGDAEAAMFRPWMPPGLTGWLMKRTEHDCQRKGNRELFPLCGFIPLTKKKRIFLGKASPASLGANAHHWFWKPDLRTARILQTPLFNPKPYLMSDLSQKTPYENIKYTQEKNRKNTKWVLRAIPVLAMPSEMNHLHLLDLPLLRQVPDEPFASWSQFSKSS